MNAHEFDREALASWGLGGEAGRDLTPHQWARMQRAAELLGSGFRYPNPVALRDEETDRVIAERREGVDR